MPNELIRPIDADTARAIEELSKTASKGIEAAEKVGGYAAGVVGRTPHDLIAFVFGDRLAHWRFRQLVRLQEGTREYLARLGVREPEENPSVEIPLLEAAIDEGREELVELWAKLWAAAMDPKRKQFVRADLITTLKQLEPLDAKVLQDVYDAKGAQRPPNGLQFLIGKFGVSQEEMVVCFQNLERLGCFVRRNDMPPESGAVRDNPTVGPRGLLLMRAVN